MRRLLIGLLFGLLLAGPLTLSASPALAAGSGRASHGAGAPAGSASASGKGDAKASKLGGKATFGIGPSTANKEGAFTYVSGPGGVYTDKAVITNYSHFPLTLQVYQASLTNSADGGIQVSQPGQPLTDAGTWVALPTGLTQVRVAAATSTTVGKTAVPFQLRVPSGAEPGDHAAAIVASLVTLGKNPRGQNVRLEQRIAARIYVRVAGPVHAGLQVQGLSASYRGTVNPAGRGSTTVSYTLQNTGNVRLSFKQSVSVSGLLGTAANSRSSANVPLLFPGSSLKITQTVPGVFPTIFQKAHVVVMPTILSGDKPLAMPAVSSSTSFLAIPWTLLAIVVALLAVLGVLLYLRRRRSSSGAGARATRGRSRRNSVRPQAANGRHRGAEGMSRVARRIVLAGVAFCFASGAVTLTAAHADSGVPFTDSNAKGYIGLCNASGQQITSGGLSDLPFAVRAVSSSPLPPGYTVGAGAKATLFAYLPMKGVDPGDWSGSALTGSSFFSNPAHPMAEGTVLDYSLGSFTKQATVFWDNLVQLRMFVGEPDKPTYTQTYPATVLKIDGSTWHVVQGGTVDCSAGKTKTLESLALPASRFASASASISASKAAAARASGSSGAGNAAGGAAGSGHNAGGRGAAGSTSSTGDAGTSRTTGGTAEPSGAAPGASQSPAAASSSSGKSGPWGVVVTVVFGVLVLAGGALYLLRRRPRSTS